MIILKSIIGGLEESYINPVEILGNQVGEYTNNSASQRYSELNNEEIIEIQESIMRNLAEEIRKAKQNSRSF